MLVALFRIINYNIDVEIMHLALFFVLSTLEIDVGIVFVDKSSARSRNS